MIAVRLGGRATPFVSVLGALPLARGSGANTAATPER